jgi:hypothetical protein
MHSSCRQKSGYCCLTVVAILFMTLAASAQQTGNTAGGLQPTAPIVTGCSVAPASNTPKPGHFHTTLRGYSENCKTPLVVPSPRTGIQIQGPVQEGSPDGSIVPFVTTYQTPETPASLGCIYAKSPLYTGCASIVGGAYKSGGPSAAGYGVIVLVDAYNYPGADSDFGFWNKYWGLTTPPCPNGLSCGPSGHLGVIYANGNGSCTTPANNAGWAIEESLDIQAAHIMAPNAAIVLVEACSSSGADLYYAEQTAFNYIQANYPAVGGQISNSWGGGEYASETGDDHLFQDWNYTCCTWNTHILAFASAGDCGYLNQGCGGNNNNYPSVNPMVISAGGSGIYRYTSAAGVPDQFYNEHCWGGSGGGPSTYETYSNTWNNGGNMGPWAPYGYPIFGSTQFGTGKRAVPDLGMDADPNSGLWIYNTYALGGWAVYGGTSLASPLEASLINRANNRLGTVFLEAVIGGGANFSAWEHNLLYSQLATKTAYAANFYDVTLGSNGGSGALSNYDECTGVGTPRGLLGK